MHELEFCRPKNSYSFERLELGITSFLSTFYSVMNWLLTGLHEKSTMGSRLDLQMSAHRKDSVGPKGGNSKDAGLVSGRLVKQGSWSMQNQDAFQEFEKCLESFSIRGEGSQQHDFLFFDLQYLTGRLSFPGHSGFWFRPYFHCLGDFIGKFIYFRGRPYALSLSCLTKMIPYEMVGADELVFYSLKERSSKGGATLELSTVKLAKLLYCALYRCQVIIGLLHFDNFLATSSKPLVFLKIINFKSLKI